MFQRARSRVQEQQKRRGKRSKKPKTWDKSTYQIKTINIHWKFMCEMQRYVDYCWCLVPLHVRSLFYGRLKICFFFISFRFGPLRIYFPQTELSSGSNKISRKIWKFGSLYWEKMKKKTEQNTPKQSNCWSFQVSKLKTMKFCASLSSIVSRSLPL